MSDEPQEGDVRYNAETWLWERYCRDRWESITTPAEERSMWVMGP